MATELVKIVGQRRKRSGEIENCEFATCRVMHNGRQVGVKPGSKDAPVVFLPWADPACYEQVIEDLTEQLSYQVQYRRAPCMPEEESDEQEQWPDDE